MLQVKATITGIVFALSVFPFRLFHSLKDLSL